MTLATPDLAIAQPRAAETVFMMRGDTAGPLAGLRGVRAGAPLGR